MQNKISKLFGIQYPVVSGGMVWCSGWRLASAVSNAGGLGLIGAGSMRPDVLAEHIQKIKQVTDKPYGVNIPLISTYAQEAVEIVIQESVPIVFTSAGSPKKFTSQLQEHGVKVVHVVSSALFAQKSETAGVDAVVAEGFEAGGHNGREETTTLTLVELVKNAVNIPVIAAGGISTGRAIYAVQALGADGVQIGSLFAASEESSASTAFKQRVVDAREGETILTLKKLAPVRMIRNDFCQSVLELEHKGAEKEQLADLLGKGRARMGIFEGDMIAGELEIGQASALIGKIEPVATIMQRLIADYNEAFTQTEKIFS